MSDAEKTSVRLWCPHCKREMRVALDRTDPPNTAEVHAACPECADSELTDYFDEQGRQIDLEGRPM